MITFIVGPEKKDSQVHKGLLGFYSDHFDRVFNESNPRAMEELVFKKAGAYKLLDIFKGWLYTRQLENGNGKP